MRHFVTLFFEITYLFFRNTHKHGAIEIPSVLHLSGQLVATGLLTLAVLTPLGKLI